MKLTDTDWLSYFPPTWPALIQITGFIWTTELEFNDPDKNPPMQIFVIRLVGYTFTLLVPIVRRVTRISLSTP